MRNKPLTTAQRERNLKLAEALESKEYKQARGQLRVGNKFCCLGVACDIYSKETGKGKWVEATEEEDAGFKLGKAELFTKLPPLSVAKWFGWISPDGDGDVEMPQAVFPDVADFELSAAHLNDEGATFKKIAKGFRVLAAA